MLAVQVREWEDSARLSAFGMTTLLQAHFPGLTAFLSESLVSSRDIKCLESTVNVERFCYHLESLSVSFKSMLYDLRASCGLKVFLKCIILGH